MKSLNYDSRMATSGMLNFVKTLNPQLRIAITMAIYKDTFKTHIFFKELGNRRLLAFIG